jgi:Carboxypeptidase regulatory-like domain
MQWQRVVVLGLFSIGLVLGQDTRGNILGYVTDSSGSPVDGVAVTIKNVDTNVVEALKTNKSGYYEAPLLIIGNYSVTVEAPGFKKEVREGLVLVAGSHIGLDFKLEVGSASEAVTVKADVPLVNSDTLSSGITLDSTTLMNVPFPGDNVMELTWLTPGVQGTLSIADYSNRLHSGGPSSGTTVYGGVGGNEYTLDGITNQEARGTGFNPPPEVVEALRVETSGFDASLGHATGTTVALMTRSGTNQYHGSLRYTFDQASWSALDFFTKQSYYQRIASANAQGNTALANNIASNPALTPYHHNQYAAAIGGPVVIPKLYNGRNKMFFFLGYAGFQINEYRQSYATFPTAAMRAGDFSQLLNISATNYQIYNPYSAVPDPTRPGHVVRTPFPGNIVPASLITNPVYKFYSSYLPLPNIVLASNAQPTNDFTSYSAPYRENYNAYTNRYDYDIDSNNRIMVRWEWNQWKNINPTWQFYAPSDPQIWEGSGQFRHNVGAGLDYVHNFGANTILDLSFGSINYFTNSVDPGFASALPSSIGFPSYLDTKTSSYPQLPSMSWGGWTGFSPAIAPGITTDRVMSIKADVVHQMTKHTIKAGADFRSTYFSGYTPGNNAGSFGFDSTYTQRTDDAFQSAGTGQFGSSWAAFMLGVPTTETADINANYALHNPYYGFYAQDNWRVTEKLSLTLGLRTEYVLGGTERYNRLVGQFNPTLTLPITAGAQAAYGAIANPPIPASAFSVLGGATFPGVTGAPRAVWNNSLVWMPRLAAAYQINQKTVIRAGAGTYYDSRSVQNETVLQTGYSWTTSTTISNNLGQSFLVGNPSLGTSPMSDPFPLMANGQRFQQPPGSALGAMDVVGKGFTYLPYNRPPAGQYRWRADVQRSIGSSTVVDVAYSGSYSNHILINQTLNAVPAQYWNFANSRNNTVANNWNTNFTNPFLLSNFSSLQTSNPLLYQYMSTNSFFTSSTTHQSVLWAPYAQMNGLTETVPLGRAKTEELDVSINRRFASGFNLNASYTRMGLWAADYFPNSFDTSPAFEPTNNGRPHRIMGSAVIDLPFGSGRRYLTNGIVGKVVGGFQVTLLAQWQPGAMEQFSSTAYFIGPSLSSLCSGPHTLSEWFNPADFVTNTSLVATTGQARTFPNYINACRGESLAVANGSASRNFKIRERLNLQLRWDVYNLTNHSEFSPPNASSPTATNFGQVTTTVAGGGGTPTLNRSMRVMARIVF